MTTEMPKRSSMTVYSSSNQYCHRVRMVLAEKGIEAHIVHIEDGKIPEEVAELNPYNTLPTLLDRDLGLHQSTVILEYLDERFPYPPLMPTYPVARAQSRLIIRCMLRDWCELADKLLIGKGTQKALDKAHRELSGHLAASGDFFSHAPFFMSDEFTLLDCCLAPLLWRLPLLGLSVPKRQKQAINAYAKKVFARQSFQDSLSETEQEMHQ